ncbi:MAG: hypothetical protein GY747_13810 [Planctomycetes bacterium]|nr:hypothetical protein [Planctomycetota bacterium]MCP4772383.1 hypothetical protein [Planctomycetota bacterium]MCP4861517.1 hypothetical protein [Planctomycetota bacterium]
MIYRLSLFSLLVAFATTGAFAQGSQTLPAGFDTNYGVSSSSYPFNTASDHKWHWHYDSEQFEQDGPIFITQIYVRPESTITSFDFPSVEILMASSPTDYTVNGNGVQDGHNPIFDLNLNPDAMIVRAAAPWTGTNVTAYTWLSLELDTPFLYDPTLGNDFVVQIQKCGTNSTWGSSIDGQSAGAGVVGGNRYGNMSSCTATTQSTNNNEFVPLLKIDWEPSDPRFTIDGMVGGALSTFTVEYIDPQTPVTFLWSTAGPGPLTTGLGDLLLSPPISRAFPVLSQPDGTLELSSMIPASLSGSTFFAQTMVTRDGDVMFSNALQIPVL